MSLSIIVPVYNEEQNAIKTINNLIKLKRYIRKFEIIFIDDFSNDNTFKKIKKISRKNYFIKVFKNKKKGLGSAIEIGIKKSTYNSTS